LLKKIALGSFLPIFLPLAGVFPFFLNDFSFFFRWQVLSFPFLQLTWTPPPPCLAHIWLHPEHFSDTGEGPLADPKKELLLPNLKVCSSPLPGTFFLFL